VGGWGHRAPFIIRFAWLSTCHESLPLPDHIPNQAPYKSVQSQQALLQNQSYPQMSPANLGFEKNLQGVLVHFIPLRNCNKLLILPVCSGTARRTEFYTGGQQHHVENALAYSIYHLTQTLRSSIFHLCCHLLNRSLFNVLFHSFSRSRTLSVYQHSHCRLLQLLTHSRNLTFSRQSLVSAVRRVTWFTYRRSVMHSVPHSVAHSLTQYSTHLSFLSIAHSYSHCSLAHSVGRSFSRSIRILTLNSFSVSRSSILSSKHSFFNVLPPPPHTHTHTHTKGVFCINE